MESRNVAEREEFVSLEEDVEYLLECNRKAVGQFSSRIVHLRRELEALGEELKTEEARLAFCLFEKQKLLEELERVKAVH